ncbi:HAD family hydrolase [Solidesulfovibrio magneticus]|uniref:phosphoglycolate phosphatase n=1 Tax=Solidesulfovibrio magneticus (strain ATCC 700980 / DSM 13731 / RS-1) TaxID=573370 RepID=C4XTF9_SOLM1|nr:HAD-IA family hydrolase [Solidesulfovibrio magneticus]BAH75956.1 haloacid dehalogenase-like hydrolase family protein [Solidesulfovibrio magneticus RS-1]
MLYFDFDGVVADSVPALHSIYSDFLIFYDITPQPGEFERLNGPSLQEIVACLKHVHGLPGDVEDLLARYEALRRDAYAKRIKPFADVARVLDSLAGAGQTLHLVTASEPGPVRDFLATWRLTEYFREVVCGNAVARAKPAPDLYLLAMERSEDVFAAGLAIEDSVNGVRSAVSAGLRVFGVHAQATVRAALTEAGAWRTAACLGDALPTLGAW